MLGIHSSSWPPARVAAKPAVSSFFRVSVSWSFLLLLFSFLGMLPLRTKEFEKEVELNCTICNLPNSLSERLFQYIIIILLHTRVVRPTMKRYGGDWNTESLNNWFPSWKFRENLGRPKTTGKRKRPPNKSCVNKASIWSSTEPYSATGIAQCSNVSLPLSDSAQWTYCMYHLSAVAAIVKVRQKCIHRRILGLGERKNIHAGLEVQQGPIGDDSWYNQSTTNQRNQESFHRHCPNLPPEDYWHKKR
jgi:hypothetical protein